ncbi:MAG: 16S rRNA (cytosine(1402)-N(4))-methyltransferase RsmH [Oscillospiraceae bacterium]|nr:16S rRNA (cytosine(1402)-N(4))-methyltransferase RsmH [Oscillospiraceae bacterium]
MEKTTFNHRSVLLHETIALLDIKGGGLYVDCTTGGGGHSAAIAAKLAEYGGAKGKLICFDRDASAITAAKSRLSQYKNIEFINANFADMAEYDICGADGVVMDLGVSSHQLDTAERGFSFHEDAPLDMRMNAEDALSAYNIVNEYSQEDLTRILFEYGEEKHARAIARGIIRRRELSPVTTTGELAEVIRTNVPLSYRNAKNPCRKAFQAIRMEVNDELPSLERGLQAAFAALKSGGRFAVITFHSLEDRLVKRTFAGFAQGCDCPRELPLCVCGKRPKAAHVTRKPVEPGEGELADNRRARSAKLRAVEKLP